MMFISFLVLPFLLFRCGNCTSESNSLATINEEAEAESLDDSQSLLDYEERESARLLRSPTEASSMAGTSLNSSVSGSVFNLNLNSPSHNPHQSRSRGFEVTGARLLVPATLISSAGKVFDKVIDVEFFANAMGSSARNIKISQSMNTRKDILIRSEIIPSDFALSLTTQAQEAAKMLSPFVHFTKEYFNIFKNKQSEKIYFGFQNIKKHDILNDKFDQKIDELFAKWILDKVQPRFESFLCFALEVFEEAFSFFPQQVSLGQKIDFYLCEIKLIEDRDWFEAAIEAANLISMSTNQARILARLSDEQFHWYVQKMAQFYSVPEAGSPISIFHFPKLRLKDLDFRENEEAIGILNAEIDKYLQQNPRQQFHSHFDKASDDFSSLKYYESFNLLLSISSSPADTKALKILEYLPQCSELARGFFLTRYSESEKLFDHWKSLLIEKNAKLQEGGRFLLLTNLIAFYLPNNSFNSFLYHWNGEKEALQEHLAEKITNFMIKSSLTDRFNAIDKLLTKAKTQMTEIGE